MWMVVLSSLNNCDTLCLMRCTSMRPTTMVLLCISSRHTSTGPT
jgi:hypothetical protein